MADTHITQARTQKMPGAVDLLQNSYSEVAAAVAGLDEAACLRSPGEGLWSITNVLEHLVIIEERVQGLLRHRLFSAGAPAEHRSSEEEDAALVAAVSSRASRIQAPDPVCPSDRFQSCPQALAALGEVRLGTLAYAKDPPGDLKSFTFPHPILGPINGYQWLLAVAAHTNRHVGQIEEIKLAADERR